MKSIIFSGESVQAILDGRKTQTRRVVRFDRPPPESGEKIIDSVGILVVRDGQTDYKAKPPYTLGDIVYVKETWREFSGMTYCWQGGAYIPAYDFSGINYRADDVMIRTDTGNIGELFLPSEDVKQDITYDNWRSPIFMPEEAARLHIRITDVKAERLHDIVKDGIHVQDIRREGIIEPCSVCETLPGHYNGNCRKIMAKNKCGMINAYANLWNSLHTKDGNGWNMNRWVWVYTFKVEKE